MTVMDFIPDWCLTNWCYPGFYHFILLLLLLWITSRIYFGHFCILILFSMSRYSGCSRLPTIVVFCLCLMLFISIIVVLSCRFRIFVVLFLMECRLQFVMAVGSVCRLFHLLLSFLSFFLEKLLLSFQITSFFKLLFVFELGSVS